MIGFDTGFFVKFLEGNEKALNIWKEIIEGEEGFVSCLTLFELERLSLKGRIKQDITKALLEILHGACKIVWLNNKEVLSISARLSHTFGIPSIDSLILAGFLLSDVKVIYTTDSDLEVYKKKGLRVVKL